MLGLLACRLLAVAAWCCTPALLLCHSSHPVSASASALPALRACPFGPWQLVAPPPCRSGCHSRSSGSLVAAPSSPHPALPHAARTTAAAVCRWGLGMGIGGGWRRWSDDSDGEIWVSFTLNKPNGPTSYQREDQHWHLQKPSALCLTRLLLCAEEHEEGGGGQRAARAACRPRAARGLPPRDLAALGPGALSAADPPLPSLAETEAAW
uniref:Uncharacterized protein n=1 Tax=Oryza glumipatula TaxID=40148 RepID=A0A0E0AIC3_9ORYZ